MKTIHLLLLVLYFVLHIVFYFFAFCAFYFALYNLQLLFILFFL